MILRKMYLPWFAIISISPNSKLIKFVFVTNVKISCTVSLIVKINFLIIFKFEKGEKECYVTFVRFISQSFNKLFKIGREGEELL